MAEIQQILEGGVALNWESPYGETALLVAVAAVQTPAVQLLIGYGADALFENKYGESPLTAAAKAESREIIQLLIACCPSDCDCFDKNACACFLETEGRSGGSALSVMAAAGKDKAVHLLLSMGAKVNFESTAGIVALQCAAANNCVSTIQLLYNLNADVNQESKATGQTAVLQASANSKNR